MTTSKGRALGPSELANWEKGLEIGSLVEARFTHLMKYRVPARIVSFNVLTVRVELLESVPIYNGPRLDTGRLQVGAKRSVPLYTYEAKGYISSMNPNSPTPKWSESNGIFPLE